MLKTKLMKTSPRRLVKTGLVMALSTTLSSAAFAGTTDGLVPFSGVVLDSCTVTVNTAGSLGINGTADTLSSEETGTGGLSAVAAVVTNSSNSSVSVLPPVTFDVAPTGSNTNTTFSTNYELVGTTNAIVGDGTTVTALNSGASVMTVNASAAKSVGTYDAGLYTMTATVRCVSP